MQSTLTNASMNEVAYAVACSKFWYFCSTIERRGLGLAGEVAGDDLDRAELAEGAGQAQHDAVHDGPLDAGQRDPPERLAGAGAEAAGRLLLVVADLGEHRHDLADDQRQRHEAGGHDHARAC